jgi:two-component system chemotaxis response regulator CheY
MQRVLVVDDSALMRETIREIVEAEDFEVVGEARNGTEGLELFEMLRPDVVLLDLLLPQRSGLEVLEAIRRVDTDVAVVVCSGLGQESLTAEAVVSGANDFVVKPFHPFRLLTTLWKVGRKKLTRACAS